MATCISPLLSKDHLKFWPPKHAGHHCTRMGTHLVKGVECTWSVTVMAMREMRVACMSWQWGSRFDTPVVCCLHPLQFQPVGCHTIEWHGQDSDETVQGQCHPVKLLSGMITQIIGHMPLYLLHEILIDYNACGVQRRVCWSHHKNTRRVHGKRREVQWRLWCEVGMEQQGRDHCKWGAVEGWHIDSAIQWWTKMLRSVQYQITAYRE